MPASSGPYGSPSPRAPRPRAPRPLAFLPIAITALCAALTLRMARSDPRYLLPLLALLALIFLPPFLARRRMRRLMISGDVEQVLGTWEPSIERVMYPETMAPLMEATAYAAYGWLEAARAALGRSAKGPAWDAALEQRLFVETLLDTFEGEPSLALRKADALNELPVTGAGLLTKRKVARLREGTAALARAFAHRCDRGDQATLERAGSSSPLVHWAMRYGAAVAAIDAGKPGEARTLIEGAPDWPRQSAFRTFHEELAERLAGASAPSR